MTSLCEKWLVSGAARRSLLSVLVSFAVVSGCDCQKKGGGGGNIVGNSGVLVTLPTVNFGYVAVGQKATQPLPLRNTGSGILDILNQTIDGGGAVGTFSELAPFAAAVAAGQSNSAELQFAPQVAGPVTAALDLSSDGSPANTAVTLTGTGLDINVAATPPALNFGSVQVEAMPAPSMQVTFTNNGTQPALLTVDPSATSAQFTVTNSSGAAVTKSSSQMLSAAGTYVVTVTFEPNALGNFSSSFSFTACASSDPTACLASQLVNLSGVGVNGALCITPDPIGFMGIPAGMTSTATVNVQNCGTNAVNVTCVYLPDGGDTDCDTGNSIFAFSAFSDPAPTVAAPITLTPTQSFNFTLTYTATSNPNGDTDWLEVAYLSAGASDGGVATDEILGNQMLNPCSLTITPAALNFGTVTTGTPVVKAATLTNGGQQQCNISGVALATGTDPSYSIDPMQMTSFTISAGASAPITVDFNLNNSSTPNTRKGTVDFTSNDPNHLTGTIPLVATLNATNPYAGGWPKWHLDNNNSGQTTADTSANNGTVVWKYTGMMSAATLTASGNPQGWTTGDNGCGFTYLQGPVVADDVTNPGTYYIYQMGLDGTLYSINQTGTQVWSTMTSDPSTDPHPSTPAVINNGNIWAVSGSDAYSKAKKAEAHLNALFFIAPDGGILADEPYGKDGFDACPGLAPDGTLFEADDNSRADAGTTLPPPEYSDEFSVIAFTGSGTTINLVTGLYLPLTQVSERFGVAIGDDDTSFWGNNGQFFEVTPPASGFAMSSAWPAGGVTVASNTSDKNAFNTVFSDIAIDPVINNNVYAYTAWEDGTCTGGGYYNYGTCTGPYTVQGTLEALSIAGGVSQWTAKLPATTFPTGWVPLCSDFGNAAPAVGLDGTVYVGNGDGLRAFDGASGALKWFYPTANVSSAPAIGGDGTVFFGCSDGSFYALTPSATSATLKYPPIRATYASGAPAPISTAPAIADDGTVFFTSDDGTLWAVK